MFWSDIANARLPFRRIRRGQTIARAVNRWRSQVDGFANGCAICATMDRSVTPVAQTIIFSGNRFRGFSALHRAACSSKQNGSRWYTPFISQFEMDE
jgi:hypothetical protein